jgi:hypothetical protein
MLLSRPFKPKGDVGIQLHGKENNTDCEATLDARQIPTSYLSARTLRIGSMLYIRICQMYFGQVGDGHVTENSVSICRFNMLIKVKCNNES